MKITHKTAGENVTGKVIEDMERVARGEKPIHFPKDKEDDTKVEYLGHEGKKLNEIMPDIFPDK